MKHLKPDFVLLGIILVFSGCIHVVNVPQIPELIAPEDGAVFEAEPPTFIWTSDSLFLADAYVIMIFKDSLRSEDTLVYETLEDTTYTMPTEVFDSADSGTYCWVAAVHWIDGTAHGDPRTFVIKKSESPAGLDLDTTYFPFGLGYEWGYERHNFGRDADGGEWDSYYTFIIRVVDSFWKADTLVFILEGGSFRDLGSPVEFLDNKMLAFGRNYYPGDTITLEPEEQGDEWKEGLFVSYYNDVLYIQSAYDPSGVDITWYTQGVNRKKGIGVVSQGLSEDEIHPDYHDYTYDRLLYFYNGQDTVWKAE